MENMKMVDIRHSLNVAKVKYAQTHSDNRAKKKIKITIFVKNPIVVLSICPHNYNSTLTHPECWGQIQRSLLFSFLYRSVYVWLPVLYLLHRISFYHNSQQEPKKYIYPIENMEPCLLLMPMPYCESVRIFMLCVYSPTTTIATTTRTKPNPSQTNTQTPNDTKKVSTNAINHLFSTSQ